jgi:hypothetical protein
VLGWIVTMREGGFGDRWGLSVEPVSKEHCNSVIIRRLKSKGGTGIGGRRREFRRRGRARRAEGTREVFQE